MSEPADDGKRSVLHVTTVPVSLGFLRELLDYLKVRGWTVHVLSAPGAELDAFGESAGVTVHGAPLARRITPIRDLRALLRIARVLRSVRPSIVHANTPKAGLLTMLAATCCPSTIRIYQLRGLPLESARGPLRIILRASEWIACHLAHRVFCESASLRQVVLRERLCAPQKCRTARAGLANGIDAAVRWNPARISSEAKSELRAQLGIDAAALVVGFVGRLARDKGVVELADAWTLVRQAHPSAQLLLLGSLDERDPIPSAVLARLRTDASVHLCGHVPDPAAYYAVMDVLVLPSYREGLGGVVFEAAAMGKPVVATRVTGLVDSVKDGVTGTLVEPHDAIPLANAINTYLSDAKLRERHGRAGRERALRELQPDPFWEAYRAEYEALLRDRHRARVHERDIPALGRRIFDIVVAAALLIVLSPLIAFIAAAVRIGAGSPVLFRQVRAGARGEPFTLHKFRTMRPVRADAVQLSPADRVTRFGRWLRSTSLDELPELWDVLRGRMSLIGPRPLLLDYLPLYDAEQSRRHEMKPGMTGWAQIHGRNAITWEEKLRLDVWYVDHASPKIDLQILLQTLPQVFARQDITPRDRPMMEPFHGRSA